MKIIKTTAATGLLLAATALPATSATAAEEAEPATYCFGVIGVEQYWCASTESGLGTLRQQVFAARSGIVPAATSHLVDLYDDANRTGSYYALYGSACDTNADVDGSYTLPSAWNDRISSFQGFGNCETKLFQHGDYTGNTYGPVFATDYVGATMNDQASSLKVY